MPAGSLNTVRLVAAALLVLPAGPLAAQPRYNPIPAEEDRPPGFGPLEGDRGVPGFGLGATSLLPVTQEDLGRAQERMQRYDRNRDGYIDRNEAREGRWYDDPFEYDADRNGRLSREELAQRYARRRVAEQAQRSGGSSSRPGESRSGPSDWERRQQQERERREREERERRESSSRVSRENWYLAETLVRRHDQNNDDALDARERRSMGLASAAADADRDGRIDRRELAEWLWQEERARQRRNVLELPDWFAEADLNSDGQVAMSEFAEEWTKDKLEEFASLDQNGDGMIVPEECLTALNRLRSQHSNSEFRVIPSRGTIRSFIDVGEEAIASDVDVQLSITHTHDDHLNAYLVGPRGERVELFTGVGGSDDHFDGTILDEEAPATIVRARPPFAGRFRTEAKEKRQPSLEQFYGKSIAGIWTLILEARSDRPGALHGWALIFQTEEEDEEPDFTDEEFD